MQLRPCSGCRRHVAVDAARCPFCSAPLATEVTAADPASRLSRAAVFAVGLAAVAAAVTAGCWTNKSDPQHAHEQQVAAPAPDAAVDAPNIATTPPPDAAVKLMPDRRYQNHPCVVTPQGPMCAPYGAPPARRRLV